MAVIIQSGLERMYVQQENVYYYITAMNENYTHPEMPEGAEDGIVRGMYLYRTDPELPVRIQLMGSGTILREVIAAADQLAAEYGIGADIWSVTSFNLLRQDSESVARYNRLHPTDTQRTSYVRGLLADRPGPVVAATDYMKLYANQIASEIDAPYYVLGTDGFGRSDSRAALRDFFEVDQKMIVYTALRALADAGDFDAARLPAVIADLGIDPNRPDPVVS
jgi:pyruvate dehydrogenase E1 component